MGPSASRSWSNRSLAPNVVMRMHTKYTLAMTCLVLSASAPLASASIVVESTLGAGGTFTNAPCGDGLCDTGPAWNQVPTWPAIVSPVTVTAPIDRVTSVTIFGLQHTFRGDVHVYLENPAGERFNVIVRPGHNGGSIGDGADGNFNLGTYVIVESGGAAIPLGSANINGGTYNQFLNSGGGAWNSPMYPIANLPLGAITGAAGTWTLHLRDWYPFDGGSITGWKLQGESDGVPRFCFGDGSSIACPCGNNGATEHGCANSAFAAGATLEGAGVSSVANDTMLFEARQLTSSVCVFFQGTIDTPPAVIDDGLGCVGGTLIRIGTKSVTSATARYPEAGDVAISIKGSIDPLGATRYYQAYYRNSMPSFCPPATSNRTNGIVVTWTP